MLYKPQECDPVELVIAKRQLVVDLMDRMLINGKDYGVLPGTSDMMLFKAGAEKLAQLFLLSVTTEMSSDSIEDWDKGFFYYRYKATVRDRTNFVIADQEAACSSHESKYRYRWVGEKFATEQQKAQAVERKKRQGRGGEYWSLKVDNPDPADVQNTVMKMAQKRAYVGAVRIATGVSDIFIQLSPEQQAQLDEETIDVDIIETPSSGKTISNAQIGRLSAIATEAGYTEAGLKAMVNNFGYKTRKDIPSAKYEQICNIAEDKNAAAKWNRAQEIPALV